jgi:hypothetical protein
MKYVVTIEGECRPVATANKIEEILRDKKTGLQMMDGTVMEVKVMETYTQPAGAPRVRQ